MLRALKVMSNTDRSIIPYKTLFVVMKRKQPQLPITMFFTRKPATTPTASPEPQSMAESDSVANSDSSDVGSDAGNEELESTH